MHPKKKKKGGYKKRKMKTNLNACMPPGKNTSVSLVYLSIVNQKSFAI
jgi:hypothetical protein